MFYSYVRLNRLDGEFTAREEIISAMNPVPSKKLSAACAATVLGLVETVAI